MTEKYTKALADMRGDGLEPTCWLLAESEWLDLLMRIPEGNGSQLDPLKRELLGLPVFVIDTWAYGYRLLDAEETKKLRIPLPRPNGARAGRNSVTRSGKQLLWNGKPFADVCTEEAAAFVMMCLQHGCPSCFAERDWS